jgi:RimJ/RimL family protein N-acetyltransferase
MKTAWVGLLIGDSKNHGKGYGYETLEILREFCKLHLKLNKIFLGVAPNNIRAIKLYKKFGFSPYNDTTNIMYLDIEDNKKNF